MEKKVQKSLLIRELKIITQHKLLVCGNEIGEKRENLQYQTLVEMFTESKNINCECQFGKILQNLVKLGVFPLCHNNHS